MKFQQIYNKHNKHTSLGLDEERSRVLLTRGDVLRLLASPSLASSSMRCLVPSSPFMILTGL